MEPNASNTLAAETDYGYDALDDLTAVSQYAAKPGSAAVVRTFSYDWLGRLLSSSNPEAGSSSYVYDSNGNLSTKRDARNLTIRYCYDTLNRLLSKSSPDQGCPAPAPYAVWAYDQTTTQVGRGRLQVANGIGRVTSEASASAAGAYCGAFTYDPMGRPVQNWFAWGCSSTAGYFVKTAGYNLAGNQVYYENGDWRAFNYAFNGAGQVTRLTTAPTLQPSDATLVSSIGYYPGGGTGPINLGNGAQEQITRDNRLRVWMDNLMTSPTSGTAIFGWNVSYDAASNVRHMNDWFVMGNWDYTYDTLNRLGTAVASLPYAGWGGAPGAQTASDGCQYGYDPFGNRTYEGPYGTGKQCFSLSLSYGGNRIVTPGMAVYDAAGDVTSDATSNSYIYDAEGRVASVSGKGGSASYLYDPEGQRVAANVNGTTNYFAHDFQGHLAWTNFLSGGPEEIWLSGRHFGSVYTNADHSLNHVVYSMLDLVGTERAQFSSSQQRLATFTSNPFGDNQQTTAGSNPDTTHFTGKERDAESGLDYFGTRYYASNMGRFMSPDPSGVAFSDPSNPQSWNLYSYAQNNPLTNTDPDGRECVWSDGSFDSKDDSQTGSIGGCQNAGGQYYDPSTFTAGGGQDWSSSGNAGLAQQYAANEALAASLPQGPDPSSATSSNTSTSGSTTTINLFGTNWQSTQVSTGTHPFRDNNPGDIVSGGFVNNHGAIGSDGRFGVFPAAGSGKGALDSLLHNPSYSSLSINDAVSRYAPGFENNTAGYQQFLQDAVGVSGNAPLSSLSPSQFSALENGISRYEGFNAAGNSSVTTTSVVH